MFWLFRLLFGKERESPEAEREPEDLPSLVKRAVERGDWSAGHLNVLVVGRTGAGKSTLINAVLGGSYARPGIGRPVTQQVEEHARPEHPLTLIDTPGIELGAARGFNLVLSLLAQREEEVPARRIHAAWFCIGEGSRRVEEAEVALHYLVARRVPLIAVITMAMADEGFEETVRALLPRASRVLRVNSVEAVLDGEVRVPPSGLEELARATMECVIDEA